MKEIAVAAFNAIGRIGADCLIPHKYIYINNK